MNKELLIQLQIRAVKEVGHQGHENDVDWLKKYSNKLIELVVQECAKVAEDTDMGIDQVSTYIKEHFGVEK